jgi:hypothetical protein
LFGYVIVNTLRKGGGDDDDGDDDDDNNNNNNNTHVSVHFVVGWVSMQVK